MSFLRNLRWSNFASSDRPNWLISNNQVTPLSYVWTVIWNSFKLLFNNFHGFSIFSVLKLFSNACDNFHSVIQCNLCFDCDIFIAFIKERSSFWMASDCPCHSNIKKLISSDISSVRSSFVLRDILCHYIDMIFFVVFQSFHQT